MQKVLDLLDSGHFKDFKRALQYLIAMKLHNQLMPSRLVGLTLRHIDKLKHGDVQFFVENSPEYQKELIDKLVDLRRKETDKFAVDTIQKCKLDHHKFPNLVSSLEQKGLRYNFREFPLYVFEAKFMS